MIGLGEVGTAPLTAVERLRAAGYAAEANLSRRSLKAQFKSAERCGARYIVILGEEELKSGTLNLKRAADQTQVTIPDSALIDQIREWEGK